MARLRREAHARMLGNGLYTRPAGLDRRLDSACETCAYFRTGSEFQPSSSASATTPATTDRPTGLHAAVRTPPEDHADRAKMP